MNKKYLKINKTYIKNESENFIKIDDVLKLIKNL